MKSLLGPRDKAIMRVDRKGDVGRLVCSIHGQNKLVKVVEFHNCQEPEKEAGPRVHRPRSPTAEDSGKDVSCSNKLCRHVTVRGLEGPDQGHEQKAPVLH